MGGTKTVYSFFCFDFHPASFHILSQSISSLYIFSQHVFFRDYPKITTGQLSMIYVHNFTLRNMERNTKTCELVNKK